jgi:hypothetical protein
MTKENTAQSRRQLMTETTATNKRGFAQRATAQWLQDAHARFAHLAKLLDGEAKRIAGEGSERPWWRRMFGG